MGQKIELGKAHSINVGMISEPSTIEEKVVLLEDRITELTKSFNAINSNMVKDSRQCTKHSNIGSRINKDGLPIGMSLLGNSTQGGTHVLSIKHDKYYIGIIGYDSLSAAAEAVSGVRRSGWTFWKTPDGRTVKEAYGRTNGQI